MTFWQKIKQGFANFMQGRYGADEFGTITLYAGIVLLLLNLFLNNAFISLIIMVLYGYSLFRMMSRNKEKRRIENQRFLAYWNPRKLKMRQAYNRFKNRKQYKYFKCPQCKAWLRLPHGAGDVNVTCGRCQNKFSHKA